MPTPPLPLLHQLLQVLHIPVHPPTLSSISPSLLLLILETLLGAPLPLPKGIRHCSTPETEISVVKCILGVLADDLHLGVGMTLVDPKRVVKGEEREMEVMIMAFAVIAKRRGLVLGLPKAGSGWDWEADYEGWEEEGSREGLQEPIEPDMSFTSPTPVPASRRTAERKANGYDDVFTAPTRPSTSSSEMASESTKLGLGDPQLDKKLLSDHYNNEEEEEEEPRYAGHSGSGTIPGSRSRTVLDEILEEFGT